MTNQQAPSWREALYLISDDASGYYSNALGGPGKQIAYDNYEKLLRVARDGDLSMDATRALVKVLDAETPVQPFPRNYVEWSLFSRIIVQYWRQAEIMCYRVFIGSSDGAELIKGGAYVLE